VLRRDNVLSMICPPPPQVEGTVGVRLDSVWEMSSKAQVCVCVCVMSSKAQVCVCVCVMSLKAQVCVCVCVMSSKAQVRRCGGHDSCDELEGSGQKMRGT